jgi:protein TonB
VEVQLATVSEATENITNEPVPEKIEVAKAEEPEIVQEEKVFIIVEEQASFQGGDVNTFRAWVQQNVKYPPIAAENGIQGKVYVQYAVNSKGEVVDVKVVRGVDPSLDKEAVRVITSSPKWEPGKQGGMKVKQQFTIPISFILQ